MITKLTTTNLPKQEVIAINKSNEALVGYIHNTEDGFICEDEHQSLYDVTHYVEIPKINIPINDLE